MRQKREMSFVTQTQNELDIHCSFSSGRDARNVNKRHTLLITYIVICI